MTEDRITQFEARRARLEQLSDAELRARFWELCDQVVAPMVDLAQTHTSPSIERAVLLRMGVDSISSQGVVSRVLEAGLLGKGAGQVLLKVAEKRGVDIPAAAAVILEDKEALQGLF